MSRIIQPENAVISNELFERIDTMFSDMMQDYISESGFSYELDFNEEDYLEQFSFDHKVNYVIDNLNRELDYSRKTIKYYQSKDKSYAHISGNDSMRSNDTHRSI